MRNTIDVIPNPSLKGLQTIIGNIGFQSNNILKITQNKNTIYIIYSPQPQITNSNICQLSTKLCQYNNIHRAPAHIVPINKVYVSKLDWQIINNKSQRIQGQFLNQISIVWPGAILPLFYDKNNSVKLRIQCEKLAYLKENTQLQILTQEQDEKQKNHHPNKTSTTIDNNFRISNFTPYHLTKFGNINTFYCSQQSCHPMFNIQQSTSKYQLIYLKYQEKNKISVPTHTFDMSVSDQLQSIKNQQSNNNNNSNNNISKFPIIIIPEPQQPIIPPNNNSNNPPYFLNKLSLNNWPINPTQPIQLNLIPTIQIPHKKLQYLLFSLKNFKINLYIANKQTNTNNITIKEQDIKIKFYQNLIKNISVNHKIIIYQNVPFMIDNCIIGYVNLLENCKAIQDPIVITIDSNSNNNNSSNKNQQQQQQQQQSSSLIATIIDNKTKNKLMQCIQIQNIYYCQDNTDGMKFKIKTLLKLNKYLSVINININNNNQQKQEQQQIKQLFANIYQTNYQSEINEILKYFRDNSNQNNNGNQNNNNSLLISSYGNNGKSYLFQILQKIHKLPIIYIEGQQLQNNQYTIGDIDLYLQTVFQKWQGQYIFIDNIDTICYKIDAGDLHRKRQRIISKIIIKKIMEYSRLYRKILVLTAKNKDNIDQQYKDYQHVRLKNPTLENRQKIVREYFGMKLSNNNKQEKIMDIVKQSESMSFGQFYQFITKGIKCDEEKVGGVNVRFDFSKLAGMKQAKKQISNIIEKPLKYSFLFKNLPVKLSRGILLYGGSGTGKTALGQAVADQFQMKFFSIKGSDILSKYIGGSQAAVRQIFQKAMSVSPSVIFFDQFQSIVPRRNSSNSGVTDRVVNQFLCYLDGVASVEGVFIVASSSRPQLIDPALLRPGRIDSHIFLDYPTSEERQQLLKLYKNSILFDFDIDKVLELTQHCSYSDLVGLIKQLRIKKSAQLLKSSQQVDSSQFKIISQEFFKQTLKYYKISVSISEQQSQKVQLMRFKRGDPIKINKQKTLLK